jgi:hypothetical protein
MSSPDYTEITRANGPASWTIVGGVDMNDLLFLALNAIPLLAALALLWFGPWRPARRGGWLGH